VCGQSVVTLIAEFVNGKIVRRFCHHCMGDKDSPHNIEKPIDSGTLVEYTLEERLADLNGKNFVKVKQDKPN
jgi:hypothetical protein